MVIQVKVLLQSAAPGPVASHALAHPLADALSRIGRWLATAPVQAPEGPAEGGIAGRLEASGKPSFHYGEITGYWLSWASRHAPDPARLRAAAGFLARQWAGDRPAPTRLGADGDWRNAALFSFDLAMMVRGLADAAPIAGEGPCRRAAARLVPWLERLIDARTGRLAAMLPLGAGHLPDRWSTRPGPFQAKTAAALLDTPPGWLPVRLAAAAEATLAHWAGRAAEHPEMHARFYALEGQARAGHDVEVAPVLSALRPDGTFPENTRHPDGAPRADVQAQALRLLCVASAAERKTGGVIDDAVLDRVVAALLRHVAPDGSVRFRTDDAAANIWCALFAHQALAWLCARRELPGGAAAEGGHLV